MAKTLEATSPLTASRPDPSEGRPITAPGKRKFMVSLDLPVIKNAKGRPVQYAPPPFVVDATDEENAKSEYLRVRGFDKPENCKWLQEMWSLADGAELPLVVEAY